MYFKQAEAAIIVYDISNEMSFEKAQKWVQDLKEEEESSNTPILKFLVGNKCDLVDECQVRYHTGNEFAKKIGASFKEVSAKENINIAELFEEIAYKLDKKNQKQTKNRNYSVLEKSKPSKKGGCC